MLGKRSRPTIGKLTGCLRSGIVDSIISPKSPLDFRTLPSPRGQKSNYHHQYGGGIGLGLIVALDKSSRNVGYGGEVIAKYAIRSRSQISGCSKPINVVEKNKRNHGTFIKQEEHDLDEFEEEFTYVTCRGPNKSTTKVYYSGGEFGHDQQHTIEPKICKKIGVFNISPARFSEDCNSDSDFLSSCYLCRNALHGKDIYMYRGEKAFCSAECRQRQIRIDERKENCRAEASRSNEVSSSPCSYTSRGQIFSTGIVAV